MVCVTAAAFSNNGGLATRTVQAETPVQQASVLEHSRELVAVHRLSDPSFFRCYLCRLAPELPSTTLLISTTPGDCEQTANGQQRL